jgi:pilus assembly protein Flp/PilA
MSFWRQLVSDESGLTNIEYAMIAALVAVVIIAALLATGSSTSGLYAWLATLIQGVGG